MDENTLKIKLKNAQCAANVEFKNNSCYSIEALEDIINGLVNDENHKDTIINYKFNTETLSDKVCNVINMDNVKRMKKKNEDDYKKFLVDIISQVMDTVKIEKRGGKGLKNMKKHYNWLLLPIFRDLRGKYFKDGQNKFFRPRGPNDSNKWLSNFDIENVMKQYEELYKDYKFLDAVPRDFDDFDRWNFSNIDYNNFTDKGIKKSRFGVIFNFDTSNQGGSHWTSLFFDMNKKQIYYQDSVGLEPKKEFVKLMDKIEKQMKGKVDRRISHTKHQQKNSECGVYSISFILRLLNGESFDSIKDNILHDDDVNKCRSIYFNNESD